MGGYGGGGSGYGEEPKPEPYKFSYKVDDGYGNNHYHMEDAGDDGVKKGSYGKLNSFDLGRSIGTHFRHSVRLHRCVRRVPPGGLHRRPERIPRLHQDKRGNFVCRMLAGFLTDCGPLLNSREPQTKTQPMSTSPWRSHRHRPTREARVVTEDRADQATEAVQVFASSPL